MTYNHPYPINPQTEDECKKVLSYLFESNEEGLDYNELFVRLEAMDFGPLESLGIQQLFYKFNLVKDKNGKIFANVDLEIGDEELIVIQDLKTSDCSVKYIDNAYTATFEGKFSIYSDVGTTRAQATNRLFYWLRSLVK